MTRMRCMSARRGMNQVINDVVAGEGRYPTGRATKLGAVADQDGDVHWPRQRRIRNNVSSDTESAQDGARELPDTDSFAARHVVRVSGRPTLQEREICLDDIAHVQEVADGVSVADRQRRAARAETE